MGTLSFSVLAVTAVLIALLATLDTFKPLRRVIYAYIPSKLVGGAAGNVRVFTKQELAGYTGVDNSDVYLAVLGNVFDVTKGRKHYGQGGGYHFFTGKDSTRAFVTGDFTEKGLIEDSEGLSLTDILGLEEWTSFYKKSYTYIGKLHGLYYDETGQPTEALARFQARLVDAQKARQSDDEDMKRFPPCNFESRQGAGRRMWCSTMSGGIQRSWAGVPRQYFQPGKKDPRCACVKDTGAPSGAEPDTQHNNRGDLENPLMKLYDGCGAMSFECHFSD